MKNNSIFNSFRNAFNGILTTFINERNFKIHVFFALAAVVASIVYKVDPLSFAAVILAICMVMTAELINTSIEAVIDLYCKDKYHEFARIAKDAAAAAVLISSVFAVIIGILVFWDKIF